MRIGICLRTWGEKGGIGVYTRHLVKTLLALDSTHDYVLFYQDQAHLGQFSHYTHVKEYHVRAPGKLLWDQVAIPYHAAREGIDVLFHTKFSVPLLARCKTVTVVHGSERFVYPEFSHKSDMLFFKTLYPLYLRRATAIISVSDNARRDIIRFLHLDPHKIKTVHLAIGSHFRKIDDTAALEAVRAKYGLPDQFILNVGLIYPGKNIPNLLRALQLVRQTVDVKLVIAGAGRRMYQADLDLIQQLGLVEHVILPGYIPHDDLVKVYNLATAVAFPSYYESFPAIPLEAMACGCPVVISDTGGSPEAAGDAARYVKPTDVADIARGILDVLTDAALRQTLTRRGFAQVQRFAWDRCAAETLHVLEQVRARETVRVAL